jgi:hypothetical protein
LQFAFAIELVELRDLEVGHGHGDGRADVETFRVFLCARRTEGLEGRGRKVRREQDWRTNDQLDRPYLLPYLLRHCTPRIEASDVGPRSMWTDLERRLCIRIVWSKVGIQQAETDADGAVGRVATTESADCVAVRQRERLT